MLPSIVALQSALVAVASEVAQQSNLSELQEAIDVWLGYVQ
ncbi:MAG TPA: hypothetical protein VHB77_11030 [Planctomycetaceae bacterium]|nr:hypothetical protein [Planctomycetaceae bacterium]